MTLEWNWKNDQNFQCHYIPTGDLDKTTDKEEVMEDVNVSSDDKGFGKNIKYQNQDKQNSTENQNLD